MADDAPTTTRRWSRRRVAVVTGVVAVLVCAGAVWALWEPVLVEWHSRRLASEDEAVRLEAAKGLVEVGSPRAVAAIVDWLSARREELRIEEWGQEPPVGEDIYLYYDDEASAVLTLFVDTDKNGLSLLLSHVDGALVEDVVRVLSGPKAGTERALLALHGCLEHPEPKVRYLAVRLCEYGEPFEQAQSQLISRLADKDRLVREAAACALWHEFPDRLDLRLAIRQALTSPEEAIRILATAALVDDSGLGSLALRELIKALEDEEPFVRANAALALGFIQSRTALEALQARLALHATLEEVDGLEILPILKAISELTGRLPDRSAFEGVVPALITILQLPAASNTVDPRPEVVRTLGEIGPVASPAAPTLHKYLEGHPEEWRPVCQTLARLGPEAKVDVEILLSHLEDALRRGETSDLEWVVWDLLLLEAKARPAVPFLLGLMKQANVDSRLRSTAATIVGCVAPHDPKVSAALIATLQQDAESTYPRYGAAVALGQCTAAATAIRPVLQRVVRDRNDKPRVRGAAARSLACLATPESHQETLTQLLALFTDPSVPREVREDVLLDLKIMGPLALEAVPLLLETIRQERVDQLHIAAMTVWSIDPSHAPFVVDTLLDTLEWSSDPVDTGAYCYISACLEQIGDPAIPAAAVLIESLAHWRWNPWTESPAATLVSFGRPVVPRLVAALSSDNVLVRVQAAEILGRIGSDAIDAVPALEKALDDPDAEVRREAKKALERIRGER